ncbi:MAG TPA: VanZ family protein [Bacilli bacterium]
MLLRKQTALTIVLLMIYILLLTNVILFKLPFYSSASETVRVINLIPFHGSFDDNGVLNLREIIYNILLFIPLGVYISLLTKWSFMRKMLPITGLTLAYEILQLIFALGRTDVTDLLGNTLGGIIGIGIYTLLFKVFKSKAAPVINFLASALTVCVVLRFAQLFYLSHFVMGRPR